MTEFKKRPRGDATSRRTGGFASLRECKTPAKAKSSHNIGDGHPDFAGETQGTSGALQPLVGDGNPDLAGKNTPDPVVRRYTFKLYPNKTQEAALEKQCVLLARLWNAALEQREIQWSQELQRKGNWRKVARDKDEKPSGLSYYDQARELKDIRADDPEYAAMSADTMALCLKALDLAFQAFWRRAKGGAGKASGYPRYKAAAKHRTIWFRDHPKGWKFRQSGKHWKLYAKGIPGEIRVRGKFPAQPLDYRSMEVVHRDGAWWISIVVKMEPRRKTSPDAPQGRVIFDLIEEFARVEIRENGQCLPGWEGGFTSPDEQISLKNQMDISTSDAEASKSEADDRAWLARIPFRADAEASISEVDDRLEPGERGDGTDTRGRGLDHFQADAIQSARDTRFKRGSWRWRQEKRRIARLKAKEARRRREAMHLYTTRLAERLSDILVIAPPIKESTRSARGDEKQHGAAVKPVAALNRHVLAQAPAMAIQMLEYKAAEAGIPFARITPDEHALAIGSELPKATKAVRRLRRELKRKAK